MTTATQEITVRVSKTIQEQQYEPLTAEVIIRETCPKKKYDERLNELLGLASEKVFGYLDDGEETPEGGEVQDELTEDQGEEGFENGSGDEGEEGAIAGEGEYEEGGEGAPFEDGSEEGGFEGSEEGGFAEGDGGFEGGEEGGEEGVIGGEDGYIPGEGEEGEEGGGEGEEGGEEFGDFFDDDPDGEVE